jgi:hypothetical protein
MKTINDLTGEDIEDSIETINTTLVFTIPVVFLVDATYNIAITNYGTFVENYKTYLATVTNNATELEIENFANGVFNNINIKLL